MSFNIKEFCAASKYWADQRIKIADENRAKGIYDPLNELTDSMLNMGPIKKTRKTQKTIKKK